MNTKSNTLEIIAGPNGAGKSTFAKMFLEANLIKKFINADTIALGLSAGTQSSIALQAGRLMISEIYQNIKRAESLVFETTLSGKNWIKLIKKAKDKNYNVKLHYVSIHSEELAVDRVNYRVQNGGHNIPEDVIRRRFNRSLEMFFSRYKQLVDEWYLYDNTNTRAKIVAFNGGKNEIIVNPDYYKSLKVLLKV